jgi:hypothetical protein
VLRGVGSDGFGEFIEPRPDHKMTVSGFDAEFIMPATQVLYERMTQ